MLFIPTVSDDNHLVPAITEEHKVYFNPHINSLMFMWDPENCTTWDVCQTDQPNTCNVKRGVHDTLMVFITVMSNSDIVHCETLYMGQQQH